VQDGAAWLAETITRFKLSESDSSGLGTSEALEFLVLGIHGKLALWIALSEVSGLRTDLAGIDSERLIARAQNQEQSVERYRLQAARTALAANVPFQSVSSDA
jgi:hypothetical protein